MAENLLWDLPDPGTLDLWQISLPDFTLDDPAMENLLSPDEKQRASRFHFPVHRERFILAHAFLRKILGHYTHTAPEQLTFGTHPHNKPFLPLNPALAFNLSHSSDKLLISITTGTETGVDIEKIRPDIDPGIAERFFHPKENQRFQQLPMAEKPLAFFRLWTGKEAVIKMTGQGLSGSLDSFIVDFQKDRQTITFAEDETCDLIYLQTSPGYISAVALAGKCLQLREKHWTPDGPLSL